MNQMRHRKYKNKQSNNTQKNKQKYKNKHLNNTQKTEFLR